MKGDHGDECNRTACHNIPATFFNFSTTRYYCDFCALLINRANEADSKRLFGHALCLPGEHKYDQEAYKWIKVK
jgi:hypothetical protein